MNDQVRPRVVGCALQIDNASRDVLFSGLSCNFSLCLSKWHSRRWFYPDRRSQDSGKIRFRKAFFRKAQVFFGQVFSEVNDQVAQDTTAVLFFIPSVMDGKISRKLQKTVVSKVRDFSSVGYYYKIDLSIRI
jgi:hypothetical protein